MLEYNARSNSNNKNALMSNNKELNKTLLLPFLDALRREEVPVCIYLVNGIKLQGEIEAYDAEVLLLKNNLSQIVFRHAISSIVPMRPILLHSFSHGDDYLTEEI